MTYFIDASNRIWAGPFKSADTMPYARAEGRYAASTERAGEIVWVERRSEPDPNWRPVPLQALDAVPTN